MRRRAVRTLLFALLTPMAWPLATRAQQPAHVTAPDPISHVDAVYPSGEELDTTVIVTVSIDKTGKVTDAVVTEPFGHGFDEAALAAAKQWVFRPALRDGVPVAARVHIPFHFSPPQAPGAPPHAHGDVHATEKRPKKKPPSGAEGGIPGIEDAAPDEVTVGGVTRPSSHGASDIDIHIGQLQAVPRKNAQELLKLAPGIFLTSEGGEGHAEQVFLRGFDAREGQDLEFTLNGMPINDVGNPHGTGYADTHFILPELVESLRVTEGPYDPRQGNFAVAGSAAYTLGLAERGLTAQYGYGSFGAHRALLLWGPPKESTHTFGGAEIAKTDGYGTNRRAQRGTAMAQYEGKLGPKTSFRLLGTAYATHYGSAGVIRADDERAGRVGFYDSYDATQGGDASRASIALDVASRTGQTTLAQQVFVTRRAMRLRENFTGFLLDTQSVFQSPHAQRGDLIDLDTTMSTLGARGSARTKAELLGVPQELEVGYAARLDEVTGTQQRDRAGTLVPYARELDSQATIGNVGMFADASVKPGLDWITVRGGVRGDVFTYDVNDRCAAAPDARGSAIDQPCQSIDRSGYREPNTRSSTSSVVAQPRATLLVGPFHGLTLATSYGMGARTVDPVYVTQDTKTPFARVDALEGGIVYSGGVRDMRLGARSVFYGTHVDRDLVFSETSGRNVLAGGTTRTGWMGEVRLTGSWMDHALNVTAVKAKFDDTGLLLPYVPELVARHESAVSFDLFPIQGRDVRGTASLGLSYIGRRALPYGERSDTIFTADAGLSARWTSYQIGLSSQNLLDRRYRLGEFNYVSDFHSRPYPSLVAARHFTAGAPRTFMLTFTIFLPEVGG